MFERFDEQARRALFFARYELSALGGAQIDTGHLLLGLISDAKGAAHAIFGARNITYADVREQLRPRQEIERMRPTSEEVPFHEDAKRALNRSLVEAEQLGHHHIGAEHLLIAMLHDETSKAASIAQTYGLTAEIARAEWRRWLDGRREDPPPQNGV
jgi:ATP-dependent Clp protease ATP-binding subunit ClpC